VIPEIIKDAEHKMVAAVEHAREEFAAIRTGRAHPAMFNKLMVDYYGAPTPLQQLATFQVPEARTVLITPFDRGAMHGIEKAIRDSDLGVNPANDGNVIRLVMPQLTEERRREYIKVTKHKAEEARVAVRMVRQDARKKIAASGKGSERRVQEATDAAITEIDHRIAAKLAEIRDS